MRKLFIHIGTHKTGTKSFQAYLLDNRQALARAGVCVCTERHARFGLMANCFSLPNAILRPSLNTIARMTGTAKRPGIWQSAKAQARVQRFLADKGASRLIVSAEGFCFARTEQELRKIRNLFSASHVEIHPVLCIRDVGGWRESWLAQVAKWHNQYRDAYGEGWDDIRGDWYFDVAAVDRFWSRIGTVRTVDYDRAVQAHGSVVPALLDAMEIEPPSATDGYYLNAR